MLVPNYMKNNSNDSLMRSLFRLIFNKKSYIPCNAIRSTLDVAEGTIEYSRFGRGATPLILVTGYAASMNGWDLRFLDELAKSYDVIVFSNRNTGCSKFMPKEYTIECLANDVESLRLGLNLPAISLIGISMGGAIVQQYASLYPQHVRHLTLINTFPPGNLIVTPSDSVVETLKNISQSKLLNYLRFGKLLMPSIWHFFTVAVFHFKTHGSKHVVPKSTLDEQISVINGWSTRINPKSILESINSTTLILVGESDKLVPSANSNILCDNIRNAKLVGFSAGSHLMVFQYPYALAQSIILSDNT